MQKFKGFINHYEYLEKILPEFLRYLELNPDNYKGIISAHGDKCYSYKWAWENTKIPFEHGVVIYLLSYIFPFCEEVRETKNGWVDVKKWVIDNYSRFLIFILKAEYKVGIKKLTP